MTPTTTSTRRLKPHGSLFHPALKRRGYQAPELFTCFACRSHARSPVFATASPARRPPQHAIVRIVPGELRRLAAAGIALGRPLGTGAIALAIALAIAPSPAIARTSRLVQFHPPTGQLLYRSDGRGNRILDFSAVGYRYGRELLPDPGPWLPPDRRIDLKPRAGEDGAAIQAALDRLGALPPTADGWRGVVRLSAGEFQLDRPLEIRASGLVLRGAGEGPDPRHNTILAATGTDWTSLVRVGPRRIQRRPLEPPRAIADDYVPVGATSFRLENAAGLEPGDDVVLFRPSTRAWIAALGMDRFPPRRDGRPVDPWEPGKFDGEYERRIVRVEGDRVFLNAPVADALDARYGGGSLYRYDAPGRIRQVGIETLRGRSNYVTDAAPDGRSFIELGGVEDAWVRRAIAEHFSHAAVWASRAASRVTVERSAYLAPRSPVRSPLRYSFRLDGQGILMQDLFSEGGRHSFVNNSPARGPNVFYRGLETRATNDVGPHQRWSTGVLYDNVTVYGDRLNVRNRGNFGTGQGWAGANIAIWNCIATGGFIVQRPPTAQNWLVGSAGPIETFARFGPFPLGAIDAHGGPVSLGDRAANPDGSLYRAQVQARDRRAGGQRLEYVLGDFDGFRFDGADSADTPAIDPAWQAAAAGLKPRSWRVGTLDDRRPDRWVPFSLPLGWEPGDRAGAAVLTLALKTTGSRPDNDRLWLAGLDRSVPLAELDLQPAEAPNEGGIFLAIVPLDAVQTAALVADGTLNGAVGDDWGIDWVRLEVTRFPASEGAFEGVSEGTFEGTSEGAAEGASEGAFEGAGSAAR